MPLKETMKIEGSRGVEEGILATMYALKFSSRPERVAVGGEERTRWTVMRPCSSVSSCAVVLSLDCVQGGARVEVLV